MGFVVSPPPHDDLRMERFPFFSLLDVDFVLFAARQGDEDFVLHSLVFYFENFRLVSSPQKAALKASQCATRPLDPVRRN